jgi:hypothetical protein
MNDLAQRAPTEIAETGSLAGMAEFEGFTPTSYALTLASHIRDSGVSLQVQTERLAALAQVGAGLGLEADSAAAAALAEHFAILEALHQRFAYEAFKALNAGGRNAPEVADRFLSASLKAQRAAMGVLSALKVLRDAAPTRPSAPGPSPAPSTSMPMAEVLPLSGLDC